jgi:ATP-binding cassette subfamily B multidrug efflux pump
MSAELNQEEEIQERPFNLKLTLRLVSYLKPYKSRVCLAFLLILIAAVTSQIGPWLTAKAVDDYILPGDWDGLQWILVIFFSSIAIQYVTQYAQTLVTEMTGQYVMRDMRRQIFTYLQRLPMRYFDRTPVGRIMTRTTNDVDALNEFFTEGVVSVFMDLFTLIAVVVFMADMDLKLTLICCTVIPLLAVSTFYLQGKAMAAYRQLRVRLARINAYLQENISGMEVVQLFGRHERNKRHFDREHRPYLKAEERELHYYSIFFPFTEFIGNVGMALVIWFGAVSVFDARIDVGVLVAFLQYIRRFFRPIMDISDRYALLQSAMAASERIFELLDTEPEPEGDQEKAPITAPLATPSGTIEFDQVSFKYNPEAKDYILKDVSFRLEAGQSLALVGSTGSGKTTIVNLICRFYDIQAGSIKVDGRDVRHWDVYELRRRIGLVQQDVFLFSGDIQSNIRLGETRISQEQVETAARHVNAERFIRRLGNGFTHRVAESGSTLSSGERQLLSFARALAFEPAVLILDEATSSIDTETEQLIQDAIDKLMRHRTSIVIAHRLSTIRNADQILVLHHGEVREHGTHEQLIRQQGIYSRLHQLHYSGDSTTG